MLKEQSLAQYKGGTCGTSATSQGGFPCHKGSSAWILWCLSKTVITCKFSLENSSIFSTLSLHFTDKNESLNTFLALSHLKLDNR